MMPGFLPIQVIRNRLNGRTIITPIKVRSYPTKNDLLFQLANLAESILPNNFWTFTKKSDIHFQWKNREQKHGNAVPNGTWGSFEIEAGKIFRNCTLPKTKKMPRVRNHRELIAWMQDDYKDGENSRRMVREKLPTHHGVVYDKWKSNKDRRDAAERENSIVNQEINEEGERTKVVIYQDGDESHFGEVCEGGEGKENNDDRASDMSHKNPVKKNQSKSPRKPFGVKN